MAEPTRASDVDLVAEDEHARQLRKNAEAAKSRITARKAAERIANARMTDAERREQFNRRNPNSAFNKGQEARDGR